MGTVSRLDLIRAILSWITAVVIWSYYFSHESEEPMAKVETTVTFTKKEIIDALQEKARVEISKDASKTANTSCTVEFKGEGESLEAVAIFKSK